MNRILIIFNILFLIALVIVSVLLYNCQNKLISLSREAVPELGFWELIEYPDNLLEGKVISISKEEPVTVAVEIDGSKIIPNVGLLKKTISIPDDAELVFHEVTPRWDRPMELNELEVGDNVVIATKESTRANLLTQDIFTATKIIKIRTLD